MPVGWTRPTTSAPLSADVGNVIAWTTLQESAQVSVVFVGYAIRAYWKLRRSLVFWSIFLGFLVIHLLGVGYFFYAGSGLPLLVFGPSCAVELMGMGFVIYWILGVGPAKVSMNL